ncbi:MAG TPA: DNA-processing protein DprA [Polyangiaceae bacterium]|nr:DNA-processing protein DprA [Polyangiaceae bacterium]
MKVAHYRPEELLGPLNEVEKKNAPQDLYAVGHTSILSVGARVSVVGSRKATAKGLSRASRVAQYIVERGAVVVSGLAEGIDTAAHKAAIAAGGRTVAVLGTPLDRFYPPANRALQEQFMREQLVLSQFPLGMRPGRKAFPMRNRTMALISDATLIVEAGQSSGTLHQGWEALRLGRPLFLMESLTKRSDLSWPQEMLDYGAEVLSDETLEFFFEMLPERCPDEQTELTL